MAVEPPVVRRATAAERPGAVATLANAFANDPIMSWLIGPRNDREQRLVHLFGHSLDVELAKPAPLVDTVDGGHGVSLWHEVDDWKTPNRGLAKALPPAVRTFGRRLPTALGLLTKMEKAHPIAPHRHLAFIGVHRDHQGTGLGGALLAAMTHECDDLGVAAYLESSNPQNDALYARFGFVATGEIEVPQGAPRLLAMWRDAR